MRKLWLVLAVLALAFGVIYWRNNSYKAIVSMVTSLTDTKNGDLKFEVVFLNLLSVGEADFAAPKEEKLEGKTLYYLRGSVATNNLISRFFKANALLESYVSVQDNNPSLFRQSIKVSGRPEAVKEIRYDQKNNTMTLSGVSRTILPDTQDPLSIVFNLRKMDLEHVKEFEFNINTNQKNYIFEGKVTPKEFNLNGQPVKVLLVKAKIQRRDKNNPYHKSYLTIALLKTKDEFLPVFIKVFTSGAIINVRLKEIK